MFKHVCVLLLVLAFGGCSRTSAPPAVPSPSALPSAVATVAEARDSRSEAILALMERYEVIIRDGHTDSIATITDSTPVRRFLTSAAAAAPPTEGAAHRSYQVTSTDEAFPGVIEADLARDDGRHLRLLFRQVEGEWVITEPTEEELGERVTIERGTLSIESFAHYTHTDEVVAAIDAAYEQVEAFFGTMPAQELRIVLKPAFGIGAIIPFDVQAYYDHGRRPQLTVTVPWAISFRHYDPAEGWQQVVRHLVAHELTHFVHQSDPTFASVNQAPGWVAEGLAEYVAAPLRLELARQIHERDGWLPFEQAGAPSFLSLDNLAPMDRTTAYVQAQLLVAYLAREDRKDLWTFIDTYAETPGTGVARLDTALQQSLGSDVSAFTQAWSEWVEQQLTTSSTP